MSVRKRVLFVAESVTLAHVARPLVLAHALDPARYEIHFACGDRFNFVLDQETFVRWDLKTISGDRFLSALAKGARLYDFATLADYVKDELELFDKVRPDLVIGDFRLSLAISAPVSRVQYAAITNAHWSPYAAPDFPLPDLPLINFLGLRVTNRIFQMLRPAVFRYHAQPLNRLRRKFGLASLGDLRRAYTYGDYTLYADVPSLVPTVNKPGNHHYIGPVIWSPKIERPPWWNELPEDRPCIYVTLGSSGRVDLLPGILKAVEGLPVNVILATGGRTELDHMPTNVWVSDYVPGEEACRRSALVVCNGGSATAYQALAAGVPVLGLPTNMDQYLTMRYVELAGGGFHLRGGGVSAEPLRVAIQRMLSDEAYRKSASNIAKEFKKFSAPKRFSALLDEWY